MYYRKLCIGEEQMRLVSKANNNNENPNAKATDGVTNDAALLFI